MRRAVFIALTGFFLTFLACGDAPPGSRGAPADTSPGPEYFSNTTVSLTFDDGLASQWASREILAESGLKATYYIITSSVGGRKYMSREQIELLAAEGHELGGHSRTHPDLTSLPKAGAEEEICGCKRDLEGWGHTITSFAYPYNRWTPALEETLRSCGYTSARRSSGIVAANGCTQCPRAESLPAQDPMALRTVQSVNTARTLDDLQGSVIEGAADGGWIIFVFHEVCAGECPELSVSPITLREFARWLATKRIRVETVGAVQ